MTISFFWQNSYLLPLAVDIDDQLPITNQQFDKILV